MDITYTSEPPATWTHEHLERFVLWASENECSDITFRPKSPAWVRRHGNWFAATKRDVNSNEIYTLIDATSRNKSASARVKGGDQYDYAFEVKQDRFSRMRYRVNAAACRDGWSSGATMTIRAIASMPPSLDDLDVQEALRRALFPTNGLVLVTGVMGTGKSTLLSAIIRDIAEYSRKHIITYEQPIEFDLMGIPDVKGPIEQTEIPMHLKSFKEAPANAARRAADVILVGESRDPETLKGILELTEMGVAAYTTVHTRNVPETVSRIINVFPAASQQQIATTLISCLQCIVQQRLVPKVGGGRVAIREWLAFDAGARQTLLGLDPPRLVAAIWKMLKASGQTLVQAAKLRFEAGQISAHDFNKIKNESERAGG